MSMQERTGIRDDEFFSQWHRKIGGIYMANIDGIYFDHEFGVPLSMFEAKYHLAMYKHNIDADYTITGMRFFCKEDKGADLPAYCLYYWKYPNPAFVIRPCNEKAL